MLESVYRRTREEEKEIDFRIEELYGLKKMTPNNNINARSPPRPGVDWGSCRPVGPR